MRVLVFGTSNSILKSGYVDALRAHPDVTRLDRVGLGGSSSIMLPYVGADVVFGEYDYVVLDCSVNDGAFAGWGILQPSEIRENLLWVCKAALQAGCVPIFLCMPNRSYLDTEDPAIGVYREVVAECQLALIDGYAFVHATAAADGVAVGDLFMDDLHLRPEVAARLMPQVITACQPTTGGQLPNPGVRFRLIHAKSFDLPQCKRSTSLLNVDCAELVLGKKLQIRLEDGEQICGAAYNAGHTFGSIIFDGFTKVAINVRSHYFQKQNLVATVRQVSPAVPAQDGTVQVYLQHDEGVTAELLGFIVRCEAKRLTTQHNADTSAPPAPPVLTFPPQEAEAITAFYTKADVILEYGSGGSTVLAAQQPKTTTYSVESDAQWAERLQSTLNGIAGGETVHLHPVDIGPTGEWGRPTDQGRWQSFIHYPTSVWDRPDLLPPDLVLIDGRFRVGCFLATLMNITRPTMILFDDYRDRSYYRVVEELLRPTRMIGRMALFEAQPQQLNPRQIRRFGAYLFNPD